MSKLDPLTDEQWKQIQNALNDAQARLDAAVKAGQQNSATPPNFNQNPIP
jgi:hypothetical protein